ncbi:MAG: DUF4212 domain-containing protein [Opitutales bacterium]
MTPASLQRYWRSNLRLTIVLLALWAFFGLGCGILFADFLADWNLPGTGYPLGFWFAQQGSIVAFVFIVLAYALLMNRLDKRHHVELSAEEVEAARQQAAADEEGAR